ncbi:hypothetical protein CORC01_00744 [Colletotrichum orchidophilum]|uniref:Uncharacterized protein n=1 Tax=Colletotrichum orchidophilum TaxID=1209926 RepID=A0A1G4BR28_9PEZI|nr:uncharacterized protein CORC01_00744 [Colletotrichum orchidophilum]OHF03882.1 hypothetical protein CORC01_00744 [Colletotrichum orchidophilum]
MTMDASGAKNMGHLSKVADQWPTLWRPIPLETEMTDLLDLSQSSYRLRQVRLSHRALNRGRILSGRLERRSTRCEEMAPAHLTVRGILASGAEALRPHWPAEIRVMLWPLKTKRIEDGSRLTQFCGRKRHGVMTGFSLPPSLPSSLSSPSFLCILQLFHIPCLACPPGAPTHVLVPGNSSGLPSQYKQSVPILG